MINVKEFEEFVTLNALENATLYNGRANPKAMVGKCVAKFPEMKKNMGAHMSQINKICDQINSLNPEEQKSKLVELNPDFTGKKEKKELPKKDGLPPLTNTENGVVVRIEPAPSGHLHLGHLFSVVANYEVKKKFGGKFIVRIADTNPDNIDIKNYEKLIEDINWICDNEVDEIVYQSDRIKIYYKYLRELLELDKSYVCECKGETFKNFTDAKEVCPHAKIPHNKQIEMFDKFMNGGYNVGDAVVRFRADITHKNPAMRSFGIARLNKKNHARVGYKYSVWPTMHLAVAIDDALMNMTHVIRGKDHEINMDRQKLIHTALNFKSPEYFHTGRMKFVDMILSKSELTEQIEKGEFEGWDDPRVPSILSHKKRGYKAEALRKFILSLGISKRDSKITKDEYYKGLDYFNKQILETESDRYFCVCEPKSLHITNITDYDETELKLQKHPEDKSKGFRNIKVENDYFIENNDFQKLNVGDKMRLMHFGNFEIEEKTQEEIKVKYISKEYNKDLKVKLNIHFVSKSDNEKVTIVTPENEKIKAICEQIEKYEIGDSVQFERYGFLRLDSIDGEVNKKTFYFTHR